MRLKASFVPLGLMVTVTRTPVGDSYAPFMRTSLVLDGAR